MADVATEDRPIALPGRTLAVAISLLAHAVVLAVLFWKFGAQPSYSQSPVMNVQLAPLPKSRQTPEPATKSTKPHLARTPSRTDVPPLLVPPPVETRAPDVTAQPSDGVRNVLRRAAGCEPAALVGLSPAEREACRDRLAKGGAGSFWAESRPAR